MSKDKRGLGDVVFAGRIKTQTFKHFQLEQFIKDCPVIPASKLAETKELDLQRSRDFEASIEDEELLAQTIAFVLSIPLKTHIEFEDGYRDAPKNVLEAFLTYLFVILGLLIFLNQQLMLSAPIKNILGSLSPIP